MTDHDDPSVEPPQDLAAEDRTDEDRTDEDESLIDELRGTGVGVEDPNIVGDPHPGLVDEQVAKDQPPRV